MRERHRIWAIAAAALALAWTAPTSAVTSAQKCQADKLKRTGKYLFCRMKAEAKAVKTGASADYAKCDAAIADAFAAAEATYAADCPTSGDAATVRTWSTDAANTLARRLGGVRFLDNGDGTVTDTETGLMWEQKDDANGIHDKDNVYTWSATGMAPDGTITSFLAELNGTSSDGTAVVGCFAGHCDWRLPTIVELQQLLLAPDPCATFPCIDPIFGPVAYPHFYWSSTGDGSGPNLAWDVRFSNGVVGPFDSTVADMVRAVRSTR